MTTGQKIIIGVLIIVIIALVIFGVMKATSPEIVKSPTGGTGTGGTGTGTGGTGTGAGGTGTGGTPPIIQEAEILNLIDRFNYEFKNSWFGTNRCTVVGELYSLDDINLINFRNKYLLKFGESPQSILENAWSVCSFSNVDDLLIERFKTLQTHSGGGW